MNIFLNFYVKIFLNFFVKIFARILKCIELSPWPPRSRAGRPAPQRSSAGGPEAVNWSTPCCSLPVAHHQGEGGVVKAQHFAYVINGKPLGAVTRGGQEVLLWLVSGPEWLRLPPYFN